MPVIKTGRQRMRNLLFGFTTESADSLGFGTNSASDADTIESLGAGGGTSYWKTGGDVTITRSETAYDGSASGDPWGQLEATFDTTEANDTLFEIGTGYNIANHAAQDNDNLITRKRIGGAGGIGKTNEIDLIGRVKTTILDAS